jgi:hypothetical protein
MLLSCSMMVSRRIMIPAKACVANMDHKGVINSPLSPREKGATAQATHREDGCLRKSEFVTREPSKLARNQQTVNLLLTL